jgi:proteasome lid subunit RPN8/RPN11
MADKPDFSKIDLGKCIAKEYPGGDSGGAPGELRAVFGRRAYDEIRKHASEVTDREICGVLLGDLCKDAKGPFLHITEIIRGEHTASQGAQVTITHDTWNHFHKIKDSKFADKQYLGWYHSHPDFGIFLSAMDLFIHENFFAAPHQVALVVDPLRNEEGIFVWKAGKPERTGSFWVGREAHQYEPEPEPSQEERSLREIEKKVERLRGQIGDLDAVLRERPENGLLQTVLLIGIVLLLGYQTVMGMLDRRTLDKKMESVAMQSLKDKQREMLVSVEPDSVKRKIRITYVLPPKALLVGEQPELGGASRQIYELDVRDVFRNVYGIDLDQLERRQTQDAPDKKEDKPTKGDGASPSAPAVPTQPTAPPADAGGKK